MSFEGSEWQIVYTVVYRRLFASPGFLALWCGTDQKHSSDQKDARASLNSHCKGHGSIHYSSGSHAKAGGMLRKKREGQTEKDREIELERWPPFLYLSSHRDPCPNSFFTTPEALALLWIQNKGLRKNERGKSRERG